jgi:hypothetical protein
VARAPGGGKLECWRWHCTYDGKNKPMTCGTYRNLTAKRR